ncbi:MAG: AAA family ATPase [Okeania sp. SIO2H7]|nr:AAA family ATPase [Okeania sp. SIO2H7]
MKIKHLNIKSFRGIGDLTIEFDARQPTVFIGVNGVGKSSILDCLAILLSWFLALIESEPKATEPWEFWNNKRGQGWFFSQEEIKNGAEETQGDITFSIDGINEEIKWSLKEDIKGSHPDMIVGKSRKRHRLLIDNEYNEKAPQIELIADEIRSKWEADSKFDLPLAVYYPVNRSVIDVPLKVKDNSSFKQVDAYEGALSGIQINFDRFFQWFRIIEDAENEERRDNIEYRDRQLEAVRNAISSILGNDFKDLRVRRKDGLRMTVKKGDEELIVEQLSDGEKSLLALAGDLARRLAIAKPSLLNPLQGSAVVLIDEIEQHLHPAWQRQVIPSLTKTFPNCQFIITTHSPQVISKVQPDSIYILAKEGDNIVTKRPSYSFGRDSNRILEDLMGVDERPSEVKEQLLELFRLIDAGHLEKARKLRQELAKQIGTDEPKFVKADILIRRQEILNR